MNAHPEAGRYDNAHGDEGPTGPVLLESRDVVTERLDDEVDRLTAERDMLADALRLLMPKVANGGSVSLPAHHPHCKTARAALAKLEDES